MSKIEIITADECKQVVTEALREKVGHKKKWDAEVFADLTAMEVSTLDNYMRGTSLPPMLKLIRMMRALGPWFANRILGLANMTGARWIDTPEAAANVYHLNAQTVGLVGRISKALEDGRIDHIEEKEIDKEVEELQEVLRQWKHRKVVAQVIADQQGRA